MESLNPYSQKDFSLFLRVNFKLLIFKFLYIIFIFLLQDSFILTKRNYSENDANLTC